MEIVRARTPEQIAVARALVADYFRSWGVDETQDPELSQELQDLAARYGPPAGCLLYAETEEGPAAVVAYRHVDEQTCEMKRMFVRPDFRRRGVARALALELMTIAAGAGYRRMRLDTPSWNEPALAMYRSLGFEPTESYLDPDHGHAHDDWAFLAGPLPAAAGSPAF